MSIVKKKILRNTSGTRAFAGNFAKKLKAGDVVELIGDVGSGKTFFVRALAQALGAKRISSPSFVIKNEYTGGKFKILHFDFYRLDTPGVLKEELEESLSSDSLIVIEWSDSVRGVLPKDRYKIYFKVTGDNSRELTISK